MIAVLPKSHYAAEIYGENLMYDDDDISEQETVVDRVTCKKCGAVNKIEFIFGPKHGGWEEDCYYHCGECGAELGFERQRSRST